MKSIIITIAILSSAMTASATVWKGSGSTFAISGEKQSDYRLTVESSDHHSISKTKVTVYIEGRKPVVSYCERANGSENGWTTTCSDGLSGGGSCYGEGLCLSYMSKENGEAFATTIVMDGESEMRLLRTQLNRGKAVRIFREKLTKQ